MTDQPCFIELKEYGLSLKDSVKIVDELLARLGINFPEKDKYKQIITFYQGTEREKKYTHSELVEFTRKDGACHVIQTELDRRDDIFGGTFGMESPNWQMDFSVSWAGYTKTLKGPFRNIPSEIELASDIRFYREEACIESNNESFELTFRNYRAYLFSSIALVDAYINRHIILGKFKKYNSADFIKLSESRNTEERIELFLKVYGGADISKINNTQEWNDFKLLKENRNEVIHSLHPYTGAGLKELAENLNLSRLGVGGLLKLLQEVKGKPSLGFIEVTRNAPLVLYNQVTLKADGNHLVKKGK